MASRKTSSKKTASGQPASCARSVAPWALCKFNELRVLQLAPFQKFPWLVHGFSTRSGGVSSFHGEKALNLNLTDWDQKEAVIENRRRFQSALGAESSTLITMKQIHSDIIRLFHEHPSRSWQGDASITNRPGQLLGVQTADCVPILMVDPLKRVVAAVHAGWRGTLARIAEKTVGRMQLEFGSRPMDLLAALGPCIGPCCYEVSANFVSKFSAQFVDAAGYFDEPRSGEEPNPLQWLNMAPPGHQPPPKNVHLDLRKANRSQLLAAGLRGENIFTTNLCTACRTDLLFSYRREGPRSGRLLSVVGIR